MKNIQMILQNTAAISGEFHKDYRYQTFYESFGEQLGGFPGIWTYVGELSEKFSAAELHYSQPWVNHDWITAVDLFVDGIFIHAEAHKQILSPKEARKLAFECIKKS